MRLFAPLALVVSLVSFTLSARAFRAPATIPAVTLAAPTSREASVHLSIGGVGEFVVAVARDGRPATAKINNGSGLVVIQLRFAGPLLQCAITRYGALAFQYNGELAPTGGRAVTLARFPATPDQGGMVEIKLRIADGFNR